MEEGCRLAASRTSCVALALSLTMQVLGLGLSCVSGTELKEHTRFPMLVPSPTASYNTSYTPEYLAEAAETPPPPDLTYPAFSCPSCPHNMSLHRHSPSYLCPRAMAGASEADTRPAVPCRSGLLGSKRLVGG